jgi:hypothetical protein
MLRYIILVSLAMTAFATLIPTKASAATLELVPVNGLQRKPGDEMKFLLVLNPFPENDENFPQGSDPSYIQFQGINVNWHQDNKELSRRGEGIEILIEQGVTLNNTTTIAIYIFDVLKPEKDGESDLTNIGGLYAVPIGKNDDGSTKWSDSKTFSVTNIVDVEPVPEPLTIFGTATALGCGVLFKRKSSKKTVS